MLGKYSLERLVVAARQHKQSKQTGRSFHVAFILKRRKIIAVGFNNINKSNVICHTYRPTRKHDATYISSLHAEVAAAGKVKFRDSMEDLTLVSIRIDNHGNLAYAEPCPNCAYYLGLWGFKNILYSDRDREFKQLI